MGISIQDRINKILPYFRGMNIEEKINYLTIKFPSTWVVSKSIEQLFNINIVNDKGTYYFWDNLGQDIFLLFDAVDYTVEFNKSAEEKINILKEKMEELKEIFNNEDVKTLRTIEFKYKKKPVKKLPIKASVQEAIIIPDEIEKEKPIDVNYEEMKNEDKKVEVIELPANIKKTESKKATLKVNNKKKKVIK